MCVYLEGGGVMFDDKFVYIDIVCFDVGCFYLEYEMYVPRVHLRKGTLRLHYYLLIYYMLWVWILYIVGVDTVCCGYMLYIVCVWIPFVVMNE